MELLPDSARGTVAPELHDGCNRQIQAATEGHVFVPLYRSNIDFASILNSLDDVAPDNFQSYERGKFAQVTADVFDLDVDCPLIYLVRRLLHS